MVDNEFIKNTQVNQGCCLDMSFFQCSVKGVLSFRKRLGRLAIVHSGYSPSSESYVRLIFNVIKIDNILKEPLKKNHLIYRKSFQND